MIIRRCVRTLPHSHFFRKRSRSPNLNPASTRPCEPSHPPTSRIEATAVCPLCADCVEVETKFPFASSISELSRSQDPQPTLGDEVPVHLRLPGVMFPVQAS